MEYYAKALADDTTEVYLVSCSSTPIEKDSFEELYPNVYRLKENKTTNGFFKTLGFLKKLYRFAKSRKNNPSFLFYPSPLVNLEFLSVLYLRLLKRQKVFYEFNEVRKYSSTFSEPYSLRKPGYSIKKIVYKTVFFIMELFLSTYSGLVCISTSIEKYGHSFNKKTVRIPILTDPYLEQSDSSTVYSVSEAFNIGFSGSIHLQKERLKDFFKVLSQLKEAGFLFHLNLCGHVNKRHRSLIFDTLLPDLGIMGNVTYYGNLDATELSTFLSQQELLVIPRGYTKQNKYGFSTKLSDYLNHKKPILVTKVSDNDRYIFDGKNGFIVPPDDDRLMLNKLIHIIKNYDDIADPIKVAAQKTSKEHFYYKMYQDKLFTFLFQ